MSDNPKPSVDDVVKKVKQNIRITKVTVTRSIKTQTGDFFVGFSAAWDTVQDDLGSHGGDTSIHLSDGEVAPNGMTISEARIAQMLLSMEVNVAAWRSALANGAISAQEFVDRKKIIERQHAQMVGVELNPTPTKEGGS